MSLIHWLPRLLEELIVRPLVPIPITHTRKPLGLSRRRVNAISWLIGTGLCFSLVSSQAWGQTHQEIKGGNGEIVAAGFGYQIGGVSTITVKIYDAASGTVLSDDVYALDVNEGKGAPSNPFQERIFAGGVGLGATDLSNFVLRVYDAKTGKFQWEGRLNLAPRDGSGTGQMVSTVAPRRTTITKIHAAETVMRQPSFWLRALDPMTGGLVWEDEFSTDGAVSARVEHISTPLIGLDGSSTGSSHTFDFRIRMLDRSGRRVLWEDQVVQQGAQEDSHDAFDDQARVLPVWPRQHQQGSVSETI